MLPHVGASARVVNQVLDALLPAMLKLLWRDHLTLDAGQGCYAGAGVLAERLGVSRDTVERGRRDLERFGLLVIERRGQGLTSTYFATLPENCRPSSAMPKSVSAETARLEDRIRTVRSGGTPAASHSSEVAAQPSSPNRTRAAGVAAPVRISGGMIAASLAAVPPPVDSANRAGTGGNGAASRAATPGVEQEVVPGNSSTGGRASAEETRTRLE